MDKPEPGQNMEDLDIQAQELERLERQAGIAQAMKLAHAGGDRPPGALGGHATPQEYVADDYDQRRVATREVYFSVDAERYRKQLIALSRRIDSGHRQSTNEQINAAQHAISNANAGIRRLPWGKAALLGLALVAFGYWAAERAGAIAGGVAAFFLALGLIANARNNARLRLAQATRRLAQAKKTQADYSLFPEVFSATEEASGRRDTDFDLESAYRNTQRGQENQA